MSTALLDRSRVEIKLGNYGVAPATALADPSLLPKVQEYRRGAGARMVPLDRDDIRRKIPSSEYHVSRKVDGEFTVLIYEEGEVATLNPGGSVRIGLPWEDEAARLLDKAKVQRAMIVGELYVHGGDRRERVHDVTAVVRRPESEDDLQRVRFAAFDILSWNGQDIGAYADKWRLIQNTFNDGQLIHPVEAKTATGSEDVERLFESWVEENGAEGLVIRSETAGIFKIKPRHTLDAVVIGFTESTDERQGMLHDLLLAVMRHDGTLHVLSRVGGGFSDDDRRAMLSDLKDMVVQSEYAEVNADHVAYQMVRPDWVVEISCLDMISQTTRGGAVNRMVLEFDGGNQSSYRVVRRLPLAAVISPQFIRHRDDKSARPEDVRIAQVSERVEVPMVDRDARQLTLPQSQVLRREVYKKTAKEQTMVRKFLMWKTNKDNESDEYPAYVLHYTDYSPNRKAPLAREVRVSSSFDQIQTLWDGLKETNIKKGWELHSAAEFEVTAPEEPAPAPVATPEAPPKKAAAKTASAKKTAGKKTAGKTAKKKTVKKKMAPSERTRKKATKTAKKKKSG